MHSSGTCSPQQGHGLQYQTSKDPQGGPVDIQCLPKVSRDSEIYHTKWYRPLTSPCDAITGSLAAMAAYVGSMTSLGKAAVRRFHDKAKTPKIFLSHSSRSSPVNVFLIFLASPKTRAWRGPAFQPYCTRVPAWLGYVKQQKV